MARPSLKTIIPRLAKDLGALTPAALYERQRALVRAGLLQGEEGRGPGSGVAATPEAVALLLTALLATDSLSETEDHARVLTRLKSTTKQCPLTQEKTFAAAFTAILEDDALKGVRSINVVRGAQGPTEASIYLDRPNLQRWERGALVSQFGAPTNVRTLLHGEATLRFDADFAALARSLKEMGK